MNKKSLTLMEILVATVIFGLVLLSVTNLFVVGKRYVQYNRTRMTGGELGKFFLDPLQQQVAQNTWNQAGNGLNIGTWVGTPQVIGGTVTFTPNYTISTVLDNTGTDTGLRRTNVVVTWPRSQP